MNVQNIDISFASTDEEKKKSPKWLKWVFIGFAGLIILAVLLSVLTPEPDIDSPPVVRVTPTPTVVLSPTVAEKSSEIEIIRLNWRKAREDLNKNNYDDKLLQPPEVKLEFELDE